MPAETTRTYPHGRYLIDGRFERGSNSEESRNPPPVSFSAATRQRAART
jgi:hypothetical protein